MTTQSNLRSLPHSAWATARNRAESTTAPLVEREEELTRLAGLFAACGRGGEVAVVSGAVGIGKTALLHAAAEHAAASGGLVLGATGVRAERTVPLGVIRELFRSIELPPAVLARVSELLDEGEFHAGELDEPGPAAAGEAGRWNPCVRQGDEHVLRGDARAG